MDEYCPVCTHPFSSVGLTGKQADGDQVKEVEREDVK